MTILKPLTQACPCFSWYIEDKSKSFSCMLTNLGMTMTVPITIIHPLCMRNKVTVMCVRVRLSVTILTVRLLISAVQARYEPHQHNNLKVLDSWISLQLLCSKVLLSFTSLIDMAKMNCTARDRMTTLSLRP